ncbi:hypothetical protein TNCV_129821 [Trichonephila clavipes]|nr:hypothetical protein TNCV_129821 [Trichonephila clavipes]
MSLQVYGTLHPPCQPEMGGEPVSQQPMTIVDLFSMGDTSTDSLGQGTYQIPCIAGKVRKHVIFHYLLPFPPAHYRSRLRWCLARSGWNHAD